MPTELPDLPQPDAEPLTIETYRTVVGRHAAGVCVITMAGPDGPVGFTASSVVSVSSTPPILAFCVSSRSSSWEALRVATTVVVNFLAEDQVALAARFAARGVDRFDADDWSRLPDGEPVLHGTREWVRARILDRVPLGSSHLIPLAALDHGVGRPDAGPLAYRGGSYQRLVPVDAD